LKSIHGPDTGPYFVGQFFGDFKLIFVYGSPFQLFRSFSGASREYIAFHMNVELEKPARSLKPRIEHRDYFFRMSNTTIRSPHSILTS